MSGHANKAQCTSCGSWNTGWREKDKGKLDNLNGRRLDCWCKDCGHNWQINKEELGYKFVHNSDDDDD